MKAGGNGMLKAGAAVAAAAVVFAAGWLVRERSGGAPVPPPAASTWGLPALRAEGVALVDGADTILATTNVDGTKLYLWSRNGGGRINPAAWPPGAANEMHVIEFDFAKGEGLKKKITVH